METLRCKTCGGTTVRQGNCYVCEYCGNQWQIDAADDIHAVDRANAWASLREGDFEKAAQQFEEIILAEKDNHEAYWGRALARNGITYVTDLQENKKVPTCNNITENSFLQDPDVLNAMKLAPADLRGSYEKQAEQIEKIRTEWLEKASKEPAYDVFISYKDSDLDHGISRTQDSIDAQDLYNALTEEGFQVFFSRISLRDKISEQYEPYIYNAIRTAKVMVVFGEKPEYFNAVWVKNEWNRFKTRITKGEKHKNSLVVAYKNMAPTDLPVVLRTRQCLNAGDMTFLSDLTRHIKRVLAETQKIAQIEKIKITGGQVTRKAETLQVHCVKTREIGQGMIAQTSISEQQSVDLLKSMVESAQWQDAKNLADDILFENPGCAEAIWYQLLIEEKACDVNTFFANVQEAHRNIFAQLEKLLDCGSREFASEILQQAYQNFYMAQGHAKEHFLQIVLPYDFPARKQCISQAFACAIKTQSLEAFEILLTTLEPEQVDTYIQYHFRLCEQLQNPELQNQYLQRIIAVDSGNLKALRMTLYNTLKIGKSAEDMTKWLEEVLKYAVDPDEEVMAVISWLTSYADQSQQADFVKHLLQYYSKDLATISKQLLALSSTFIENSLYEIAAWILNQISDIEKSNALLYWNICLVRMRARREDEIVDSTLLMKEISAYKKYLTMVPEKRRKECYAISEKQQDRLVEKYYALCENDIEESLNVQENILEKTGTLLRFQEIAPIEKKEQLKNKWHSILLHKIQSTESEAHSNQINTLKVFNMPVLIIMGICIFFFAVYFLMTLFQESYYNFATERLLQVAAIVFVILILSIVWRLVYIRIKWVRSKEVREQKNKIQQLRISMLRILDNYIINNGVVEEDSIK